MKISALRQISTFIDTLLDSGYDGDTDITTLLADMEFTTLPDNLINILTFICTHKQNISQITETNEYRIICTMIATTDIEKLITISDELCIIDLTKLIISLNNPLPRTMNNHIINYNCNDWGQHKIKPYNTGYKISCQTKIIFNNDPSFMNILENCIQNGLYIKNIGHTAATRYLIDTMQITDIEGLDIDFWHYQKDYDYTKNLIGSNLKTIKSVKVRVRNAPNSIIHDIVSSLPSLESVEICGNYYNHIQNHELKYSIVSHKIKSFTISGWVLNGIACELFKNVEELNISHCNASPNDIIPSTVKKLYINHTNITNAMISTCTKIKYLDIFNNNGITTCAPFGRTLKHLRLDMTASVKNIGLISCTNLKILHVNNNDNITTCAPFARSLKKLYADDRCGIDNHGLKLCSKIVMLSANNNYKITTCAPFAKSLVVLLANDQCGINNNGSKLCSKLRVLNANNNPRITTCAPFANSLEKLHACDSCGICDGGLKLCSRLKYLDASCNYKITTCNLFAKTLLYLHADSRGVSWAGHSFNCGITDSGINMCTKLIKLDKFNNDGITLNLPIIYNE